MDNILESIRQELNRIADPLIVEGSKRYFKENETVRMYGIKTTQVVQLSKTTYKMISDKPKNVVFGLCEELWQSGMMEEGVIASNWAYYHRKFFEPGDIHLFERWVFSYLSNWALCDTLCNHAIGTFVEMYPEYLSTLKKWTQSDNRWARRAAAVSLIIPAKRGLFQDDIFEIATLLLHDNEDIVQKGYGWMLKAASHKHCEDVFNFVISNKSTMPRTSLRYAIEKLPEALKKEAMKK